jgi:hypothetical protein
LAIGRYDQARPLGFASESLPQRFMSIVTPGLLDCANPSNIKRVLGYLEFAHCGLTKFSFGQKLRLIGTHKLEKPVPASESFFVRFL